MPRLPARLSRSRRLLLPAWIVALSIQAAACGAGRETPDPVAPWTVVSIPDFLNVDTRFPEPGWEDALGYVLDSIAAEHPDFVLVPGDLVMGHWLPRTGGVQQWADVVYPAWKQRMDAHGLRYFAALGDHEIGDDPWPPGKARRVPEFKAAFRRHLGMPDNGPPSMKGTAFWFVHKQVLFVAVDVFESDGAGGIATRVTGEQLEWLDRVLTSHAGVQHIVVMGHAPVLTPARRWRSSGLVAEGGADSDFWKLLVRHGVDLYLAGEFHDMTSHRADGIQQVVHGGLFGYNDRVNYLVLSFSPDRIDLELKAIDIALGTDRLWQVGLPSKVSPSQTVRIPAEARERGFLSVGSLTLDKSGGETRFVGESGLLSVAANSDEAIENDTVAHWLRLKAREREARAASR